MSKEFNCIIIQNNFEYMPFSSLGNLESSKAYGKINFITKLNLKFFEQSNVMKNLVEKYEKDQIKKPAVSDKHIYKRAR